MPRTKNHKQVNIAVEKWQEIKDNADTLAWERGQKDLSLPQYIYEAVQFFEGNRLRPRMEKTQ